MRASVSLSSPFAALTTARIEPSDGAAARMTVRMPCDGIAATAIAAPSRVRASDALSEIEPGSVTPGR